MRVTGSGFTLGRFVIYPSVAMDYMHSDNLFYQSSEIPGGELVRSGEIVIAPKIMVDLPLSQSRLRFSYTPQYRDYSSDQFVQSSHLSQFFDLEA